MLIGLDNFESLDTVRTSGNMDFTFMRFAYNVIGTPEARIENSSILGRPAINWHAFTVSTVAPYLITQTVPSSVIRFSTGQRIVGVPSGNQNTGSIGIIANRTETDCKVLLAIELTPAAINICYNDLYFGPIKSSVAVTLGANAYIDYIYNRQTGELVVTVNNASLPRMYTALIDAEDELQVVLGGTLLSTPDTNESVYLNTMSFATNLARNLGYYSTDYYLTDNGDRYGMPIVETRPILTATSATMSSNNGQPLDVALGVPPNASIWVTNSGTLEAEMTAPDIGQEVVGSMVRILAQNNAPEPSNLFLKHGDKDANFTMGALSALAVYDGSGNNVELEL